MIRIDGQPDIASLSRAARELEQKQMPYVLARTATELAKRVKSGVLDVMRQRLDRPTPMTLKSLYVKAAKKTNPEARAFFKDAWTSGVPADTYLQQAVRGGQRPHKRFEKALIAKGLMKSSQYAIPSSGATNQYGNVSRGVMMKILSALGAAETSSGFQANATGSKKSKRKGNAQRYFAGEVEGTEGIWERKKTAFGDAAKPIFIFSDSELKYRTLLPFFKIADNIVQANYMAEFTSAMDHALATARK
ncbi:hypothetical protein PS3A_03280 [Pseudomonas sp. 3A(2025)]